MVTRALSCVARFFSEYAPRATVVTIRRFQDILVAPRTPALCGAFIFPVMWPVKFCLELRVFGFDLRGI